MDAHQHDMHAAYISHISHISSFCFGSNRFRKRKRRKSNMEMAGGGFEKYSVRLLKSSPKCRPIYFNKIKLFIAVMDTSKKCIILEI